MQYPLGILRVRVHPFFLIFQLVALVLGALPSWAATSFAPLLESVSGLRILESVPEGAALLRQIGGTEHLQRLTANDRWRLDQWLQHLENGGNAQERKIIQQIAQGRRGVVLPAALRARAARDLKALVSNPVEPFAPELLGGPSLVRAQAAFLRGEGSPSPLVARLRQSSFSSDPYTMGDLEKLTTDGADFLSRRWLGRSADEISGTFQGREVRSASGVRYQLEGGLFTAGKQTSELSESATLTQLVIARESVSGRVDGFFMLQFQGAPRQKGAQAYLELIKADLARSEARGLGSALYDELVGGAKRLGYPVIKLNADWTGRVVWAKKGFQFDPEYNPFLEGRRVTQEVFFRENFARFLNSEGLTVADVEVRTPDGARALGSLDVLKQPADYLNLVRLDGSKVRSDQYVDNFIIQEGMESDLGIAFLLKPYFPRPGQKVRAFQPDDATFVNDIAAPSWNGLLKLEPMSHESGLRAVP